MQMLYHKVENKKKDMQITNCNFLLDYQDQELKLAVSVNNIKTDTFAT